MYVLQDDLYKKNNDDVNSENFAEEQRCRVAILEESILNLEDRLRQERADYKQ